MIQGPDEGNGHLKILYQWLCVIPLGLHTRQDVWRLMKSRWTKAIEIGLKFGSIGQCNHLVSQDPCSNPYICITKRPKPYTVNNRICKKSDKFGMLLCICSKYFCFLYPQYGCSSSCTKELHASHLPTVLTVSIFKFLLQSYLSNLPTPNVHNLPTVCVSNLPTRKVPNLATVCVPNLPTASAPNQPTVYVPCVPNLPTASLPNQPTVYVHNLPFANVVSIPNLPTACVPNLATAIVLNVANFVQLHML